MRLEPSSGLVIGSSGWLALLFIWGLKLLQALSVLSLIPSTVVLFSVQRFNDGICLRICCILAVFLRRDLHLVPVTLHFFVHPSYLVWWLYMYWPYVRQALNRCSFCLCSKFCLPIPSLFPPSKEWSIRILVILLDFHVFCASRVIQAFGLIVTYQWMHTMCVILWLGYLSQDDIFQVHPFAYEFHKVIVFDSWVIFHCVDVSHFQYQFLCWRASGFFPASGYYK